MFRRLVKIIAWLPIACLEDPQRRDGKAGTSCGEHLFSLSDINFDNDGLTIVLQHIRLSGSMQPRDFDSACKS